jgi:hypothetical protein
MTTEFAPWVKNVIASYHPSKEVLDLVGPFAAKFHDMVNGEREVSTELHDIDAIELTNHCALKIGATIILAADKCDDPVSVADSLHASRAGGDEHLPLWGKLLTGLQCDPPIIVQFSFCLLMCKSCTNEPTNPREDFVHSALTGVDWVSHCILTCHHQTLPTLANCSHTTG